ncbi:unnamed protein product [Nezara viridula]|uniref:Major facilitator superfamily (MFS) profile domain-containing protein n=1 Tax=Nezara viridula TaxID=85310 RepID=A0A9P0HNW4_NEZVI|nr:unnamed protein product [Nezara viridula]
MPTWEEDMMQATCSSFGNEEEPLLGNMRQVIGISSQTLVDEKKSSRLPQYVAALIATIGGFVMGTVLAWTSPTSATLAIQKDIAISDLENSLIGGITNVGAMIGAAGGGLYCNFIGRKRGLMAIAIPSIIGWCLIMWGDSVALIIAGRVVLGIVMGILTVLCPLFTTEIGENSIRGTLGTYFQLQVTLGIFFDYVVGSNVTSVFYFSLICAVLPLILAGLITFMPETPQFYLIKRNEAAARKSLQWYRGKNYDINDEITGMKATIEKVKEEKLSYREAFSSTPAKRGLIIGLGVMFFQQLSGINSVIFYSADIFKAAGSTMDAATCSMIVGGVQVVATYISTLIVDRLGRKPMLFGSAAVMALSTGALGIYFHLKIIESDVSNLSWLPVTSLSVFLIVFSLGFGPIPWMFLSEIFPPSIKGPATSIACLFNWLCSFAVTFSFKSINNAIGSDYTFWIFTAISALGAVFVLCLIPETKGKSLEEIQKALGGNEPTDNRRNVESKT